MAETIYITGGVIDNSPSNTCLALDLSSHELNTTIPILNEARRSHSSTALNSTIYVFGGSDKKGDLDSIERLDTLAD